MRQPVFVVSEGARRSGARSIALLLLAAAACGKDANQRGRTAAGPDAPSGELAFQVTSSDVMLSPGQEVTYCWYFHTPNTSTALVNKWVSNMLPGSHHLILFLGGAPHADGLDTTNSCGFSGANGTSLPVWEYASQQLQQTEVMPSDDGTGKPVAQPIPANTEAAIQMHYINETDTALTAHVELEAYQLPANTPYTETEAYVTYNQDLSIPPGAVGLTATAKCPVPSGVKFWSMSSHSHKQSVMTQVMDGSSMVFQGTNWSDPGAMLWNAPFYTFNGSLSWSCTYNNNAPPPYEPQGPSNANATIEAGPSAATNEMCMAVGYYFPATGATFGLEIGGRCTSQTLPSGAD
jgi:hypothetical protein